MTPRFSILLSSGFAIAQFALPAQVQAETPSKPDGPVFVWEGEIELGYEETYYSDDPANEFYNAYPVVSLSGELSFSSGLTLFAALVAESVTDPIFDRSFDDTGLYIEELGLSFAIDRTTLSVGKVHPSFGLAWDVAAGFYGASLAEEYELAEQIGATADIELNDGGVISMALFYADDTALSRSLWFERGQNSATTGGAGNTGKLNNATIQWFQTYGDTAVQLGARYLSASEGDVSNETGVIASVSHEFETGLALFGEVAAFGGYAGTGEDANFVTLNGVYGIGDVSLSVALARQDIEGTGVTNLASVSAEYEFQNGILLGAALAWVDDVGIRSDAFGVNLIIPLGG